MRPNYYEFFSMYQLKLALIASLITVSGTSVYAGGLLTNTNHHIAFLRNPARDGAIGIDGVYSNPAGVAFLNKGFHFAFNVQNVYQTRIVQSGITVPTLKGTPYYQPFKLNGGNEQGIKEFVGKASVPALPSFQAALNYDRWGFQIGFALNGGGGKSTYNNGLGSFERQIALIPAQLAASGLTSNTPGYSVNSYIQGQQYVFGVQLGATYKFTDHLSAYAGMRFNYVYNKYQGSITDISANIGGQNVKLHSYFDARAKDFSNKAAAFKAQAEAATDPTVKAKLAAAAAQYEAGAAKMNKTKDQVKDRYLDCTQTGWGITPIIGIDFKYGRWNVASRLEFNTHLNIENNTKRDDTGLFRNGVNTPNDLPGLWTLGAQYSILPSVRVMAGYHYFFDKGARMADNKQKLLKHNTQEFLAGAEWDITERILVSAGMQRTQYGLGDGSYLSDMSFVTSSYSIGFGAKFRIMKNASVNVAYFWTNYEHLKKEYQQTYSTLTAVNTDDFTRTNKVFGVGIDIDF